MTVSPFIRIVDMFIVAKEGGGVKGAYVGGVGEKCEALVGNG